MQCSCHNAHTLEAWLPTLAFLLLVEEEQPHWIALRLGEIRRWLPLLRGLCSFTRWCDQRETYPSDGWGLVAEALRGRGISQTIKARLDEIAWWDHASPEAQCRLFARLRIDVEPFLVLVQPGTDLGDLCRVLLRTPDAEDAAMRLVTRFSLGVKQSAALQALAEQAADAQMSQKTFLTTILGPEALLLASAEASHPQTIRLGKSWFVDPNGHKTPVVPRGLLLKEYVQWLRQQIRRAISARLLDDAYPSASQDPLERRQTVGLNEQMPWVPPDERTLEVQSMLATLLDEASPQQERIVELLGEGHSREEVAKALGKARATVDVQLFRLRQKRSA